MEYIKPKETMFKAAQHEVYEDRIARLESEKATLKQEKTELTEKLSTEICRLKTEKWQAIKKLEEQKAELVEALTSANQIGRSAMEIAKRQGQNVNWDAFMVKLKESLILQQSALTKENKQKCSCADHQGGPCAACMEAKYNL